MEEFEIQEQEDYTSSKDEQFSHQVLVMKIMKKCIDAGSVEMISGWVNKTIDNKGNVILNYKQDTRKVFIECVETAKNIMSCDFDEEAINNLKKVIEDLEKKRKELCEVEKKRWNNMHPLKIKELINDGIFHEEGRLNTELPLYQEFLEEKVSFYRKALIELTKLTHRLGFYEGEIFEA